MYGPVIEAESFDGSTWTSVTGCPQVLPWAKLGPVIPAGEAPFCAVSVLEEDPELGTPTLEGITMVRCDELHDALCEP